MSEYFYYFGFAYLIDLLVSLFKFLTKKGDEHKIQITSQMDVGTVLDNGGKFLNKEKNRTKLSVGILTGIMFFIWLYFGHKLNLPEKSWFGGLALLLFCNQIFVYGFGFIYGLFLYYKGPAVKKYDISKCFRTLGKTVVIIEIIIVSTILYLHFVYG